MNEIKNINYEYQEHKNNEDNDNDNDNDNYKIKDSIILQKINQGNTYFDILLYNCFDYKNNKINLSKLSTAIDDIVDVYDKLFNFGLTLSGYQFIGLTLERNLQKTASIDVRIAYFILSLGFLISLFGSLLSFIVIEYLKGVREESPEFIIAGIKEYKTIFKLTDIVLYANSILFVAPINILIYNVIDFYFGIIFNISSGILFFLGIYFHYKIIISRQSYLPIIKKDNFMTDIFGKLFSYCNTNDYSNYINRKINKDKK